MRLTLLFLFRRRLFRAQAFPHLSFLEQATKLNPSSRVVREGGGVAMLSFEWCLILFALFGVGSSIVWGFGIAVALAKRLSACYDPVVAGTFPDQGEHEPAVAHADPAVAYADPAVSGFVGVTSANIRPRDSGKLFAKSLHTSKSCSRLADAVAIFKVEGICQQRLKSK